MKPNLLPTLAVALVAVAMGCAGPTPVAPVAEQEGRVAVGGGANTQQAATGDTTITQTIGNASVGQKPTAQQGQPAQQQPATSGDTPTQVTTAAPAQPPRADGGTVVVAAGKDHPGQTQALAPGQVLVPHLDEVPSPSPTPSPAQPSNTTTGTVQPAASPSAIPTPSFTAMRNFSATASIQVIDFARVVAVDGTSLFVTTDGGANWTVYDNVGRQQLRCLSFINENNGWVAGDNGALLQVSITAGTLTYKVLNSGTASRIPALYFSASAPQFGYYADQDALTLRKTADGGVSWGAAIADGTTVLVNDNSGFRPDAADSALFLVNDPDRQPGAFTTIYQMQNGKFFAQLSAKNQTSFSGIAQYSPLVAFKDTARPAKWYVTSDWKTFANFSSDMLTPTQIMRGALDAVYFLDGTTLIGKTTDGKLAISPDLGQTWSDAVAPNRTFGWLKPFNTTQLWGYDTAQNTLYRAGTLP
jgi:hypothetical protein